MRSNVLQSVKLAGASNPWGYGEPWLILVAVFALAFTIGETSFKTLLFAEACAIALGASALIFGKAMSESRR